MKEWKEESNYLDDDVKMKEGMRVNSLGISFTSQKISPSVNERFRRFHQPDRGKKKVVEHQQTLLFSPSLTVTSTTSRQTDCEIGTLSFSSHSCMRVQMKPTCKNSIQVLGMPTP